MLVKKWPLVLGLLISQVRVRLLSCSCVTEQPSSKGWPSSLTSSRNLAKKKDWRSLIRLKSLAKKLLFMWQGLSRKTSVQSLATSWTSQISKSSASLMTIQSRQKNMGLTSSWTTVTCGSVLVSKWLWCRSVMPSSTLPMNSLIRMALSSLTARFCQEMRQRIRLSSLKPTTLELQLTWANLVSFTWKRELWLWVVFMTLVLYSVLRNQKLAVTWQSSGWWMRSIILLLTMSHSTCRKLMSKPWSKVFLTGLLKLWKHWNVM